MDRFNSNEDVEETPLKIAKEIIYSDATKKEQVKLIESALIKAERTPFYYPIKLVCSNCKPKNPPYIITKCYCPICDNEFETKL